MASDITSTTTLSARLLGTKLSSGNSASATKSAGGDKPATTPQTAPVSSTATTTIAVTSLNQKAQDLGRLLDGLDKSITTLQSARDTINEIVALVEEAGGMTIRARDTLKTAAGYEGNKDRITELESRYQAVLDKITATVEAFAGKGVNLLAGDTLVTSFGDKNAGSDLQTIGYDLTAAGLEFRKPDFSTLFKVQDSRIDVMNAIDIAVTLRHQITSDMMLIQTRQEFSQNTIDTLNAGASTVQLTDLGDEAANLLALQVRQMLSQTTDPLASEAQQQLLKQF